MMVCTNCGGWIIFFSLLKVYYSANSSSPFKFAVLKEYGKKTLSQIRWLHIPRTGVGIGSTILHYACENLNHVPVTLSINIKSPRPWLKDDTCQDVIRFSDGFQDILINIPLQTQDYGNAVGMFRSPRSRLASQLLYMRSLVRLVKYWGVEESDIAPLLETLGASFPSLNGTSELSSCFYGKKMTLNEKIICRYKMATHFPGVKGCMTKMLLGKRCLAKVTLTSADLAEAKRILKTEFAFVGITEQTDESIRLFHGLHGGSLYSDEVFSDDERHLQYPPLPASESRFQSAVADLPDAKRRATIAVHDTFDYFDEEIYLTALEVFERQKIRVRQMTRISGVDLF